jgi:hypothetical protein
MISIQISIFASLVTGFVRLLLARAQAIFVFPMIAVWGTGYGMHDGHLAGD